jgi:hypothetical protein
MVRSTDAGKVDLLDDSKECLKVLLMASRTAGYLETL